MSGQRPAPTAREMGFRPMGRGPGRGGPGGPLGRPVEKPKEMKKTLFRLFRYIGGSKKLFFSLLLVMLLITALSLAAPTLQGMAIDLITPPEGDFSGWNIDFGRLLELLGIMGCCYGLSAALSYLQGILSAKLSLQTVRDMRRDLFGRLVHLPIPFFDRHRHGDILSRTTNDAENVAHTIAQSIASLFSAILTVTGALVIMLIKSPLLTAVAVVTVPMSMFVTFWVSKRVRKFFVRQQQLLGELNGQIEETVTGFRTVTAYSREDTVVEQFSKTSTELRRIGIRAQIFGGIMGPLMNVIGNFGYLLIAAAGGWLALEDVITIGTIQAFLLYSKQFTRPVNEIAQQATSILTAIAGAERIFEVMDTPPEPLEGREDFDPEKMVGKIEFRDVHFSYIPEEPVLRGVSFTALPGQKIAIVGATGSGKTTALNLLTRFYEPDAGGIYLDGENIRDIPLEKLRAGIAVVLQDTVIFSTTVGENIRYGKENATEAELLSAADAAEVLSFTANLPQGMDTPLSEAGSNLSQGQRQLIAIARACLADPRILVLDEATSSVDTRTEMNIQTAMTRLMENRTSLIIAHRLSTIRDADKILVMEGGVIAEEGTHQELLARKGCYYRLYQSQFEGYAT